jgi:hypothetical protein
MQLRRSSLAAGALALALMLASATSMAFVSVGLSITIAPPALPIYEQPQIPGPGYLWVPGYWAWSDDGYYWVPGTWVFPPRVGFLWTPGYWGWSGGVYVWNPGYWGPRVGYYGGIAYGFGYTGVGYAGGYWDHDRFYYNRAVNHVDNVHITNVYNRTVINNVTVNRVSYNGGAGGVHARPTPEELAAAREPHIAAAPLQIQHEQAASHNPQLRANFNHGRPPIAATPHPAAFQERGVVGAVAAPEGRHVPERPVDPRSHANGMGPAAPGHNPSSAHSGFAPAQPGPHLTGPTDRASEYRGAPAPQYHAPAQPPQYHGAPAPTSHAAPSAPPRPAERPQPRGEPPREPQHRGNEPR